MRELSFQNPCPRLQSPRAATTLNETSAVLQIDCIQIMAHAAIIYDKHAVIQKLQKRGFTHDQAESIAEVLADPYASVLAPKLDLQVLKTDIEKSLHRQTWG